MNKNTENLAPRLGPGEPVPGFAGITNPAILQARIAFLDKQLADEKAAHAITESSRNTWYKAVLDREADIRNRDVRIEQLERQCDVLAKQIDRLEGR